MSPDRDAGLDFVKGFLVVAMVIYHAMNYFSTASAEAYGYLRFVNGAFVFMAGLVCTLGAADRNRDARVKASLRLLRRGLKLLALFTVLNLLIGLAGVTSYKQVAFDVGGFMGDLASIYATGDSPRIAFRILMPIAYTLMLAPAFLLLEVRRTALVVMTLAAAALYPQWLPFAPTPYFVLIGLTGACLGLVADPRAATRLPWLAIGAGFAALLPLMNVLSGNVLGYCVGMALVLRLVYDASRHLALARPAWQATLMLGRYSLLGYITQIVLLFGLYKLTGGRRWGLGIELPMICVSTVGLLVLLCGSVSRLRSNRAWIDRGYRAVFA